MLRKVAALRLGLLQSWAARSLLTGVGRFIRRGLAGHEIGESATRSILTSVGSASNSRRERRSVRWQYRRRSPYVAVCLAVGCVLGLATIGGMILSSATPAVAGTPAASDQIAPASCVATHTNVEGYNAADAALYGNEAMIYVSDSATLNSSQAGIYRSLFIWGPPGNDVEVGWAGGPETGSPMNEPTVYSEWVSDGADSYAQWYGTINSNTDYHFKVENVGDIGIWRFYFDGDSTPFKYSPTMNFNTGYALTNSEHHNNCDSMWAHFYGLGDSPSIGNWTSSYGDLECWTDNSVNDWLFYKDSNSENHVYNTIGITC